jgi:4-hydroxybenzoate polyprenyltransferase
MSSTDQPRPTSLVRATAGQTLRDLLALCRPKHWIKNSFVLAPLVFSNSFQSLSLVRASVTALVCFCIWSSAVYLLNDVLDAEADRRHPRKRLRPISSGRITPLVAIGFCLGMTILGAIVACVALPLGFLLVGGLYLANSLAYCAVLKHHVIADVLAIAIGFVLRLVAGCVAITVPPSSWLLVCGFSLALVLGFGKRRTELLTTGQESEYRPTLRVYDARKLDTLLSASCSMCLISYVLYTVAPETVKLHETTGLVYTVPLVAYGLFRFIFKVQEGKGDGPVDILTGDPTFLLTGLAWAALVLLLLTVG